jgi:hypothetical protein
MQNKHTGGGSYRGYLTALYLGVRAVVEACGREVRLAEVCPPFR